ncbi:hypothetical protein HYPSUDRAFT_914241 [Hypholoma sublateritium FD-334 SS-4]|uniref:Uncharacterized protein n=1 Tax=Hypholoma sublateritium (strain FD-334 SS-4) TaxID=945553 RepID=A0A0D2NPY8_HYPSF|nr:hypothetical protein HYPSUDRAFT_914241 [Hypholoma sublateritium FD-334 SS-4]
MLWTDFANDRTCRWREDPFYTSWRRSAIPLNGCSARPDSRRWLADIDIGWEAEKQHGRCTIRAEIMVTVSVMAAACARLYVAERALEGLGAAIESLHRAAADVRLRPGPSVRSTGPDRGVPHIPDRNKPGNARGDIRRGPWIAGWQDKKGSRSVGVYRRVSRLSRQALVRSSRYI